MKSPSFAPDWAARSRGDLSVSYSSCLGHLAFVPVIADRSLGLFGFRQIVIGLALPSVDSPPDLVQSPVWASPG